MLAYFESQTEQFTAWTWLTCWRIAKNTQEPISQHLEIRFELNNAMLHDRQTRINRVKKTCGNNHTNWVLLVLVHLLFSLSISFQTNLPMLISSNYGLDILPIHPAALAVIKAFKSAQPRESPNFCAWNQPTDPNSSAELLQDVGPPYLSLGASWDVWPGFSHVFVFVLMQMPGI